MTAYFDDTSDELRVLLKRFRDRAIGMSELVDGFHAVEARLVWDCTLASSTPSFPAELRLAVHRAVLRHGIRSQPENAVPADFETEEQHHRRLQDLQSALHDVFHAAVVVPDSCGDTPTTWVMAAWVTPRELEREQIAATEFGGEDPGARVKRILAELERM